MMLYVQLWAVIGQTTGIGVDVDFYLQFLINGGAQ